MSDTNRWLHLIQQFAPLVLAATPLAPLAPFVALGIAQAESLHGASHDDKLAHAMEITRTAVAGVNAQAGKILIDPVASDAALAHGISAVVQVVNVVHHAHLTPPVEVSAPGAR